MAACGEAVAFQWAVAPHPAAAAAFREGRLACFEDFSVVPPLHRQPTNHGWEAQRKNPRNKQDAPHGKQLRLQDEERLPIGKQLPRHKRRLQCQRNNRK